MSRIPFTPFASPELGVAAGTRSTLLRAGSRRYHATDGTRWIPDDRRRNRWRLQAL